MGMSEDYMGLLSGRPWYEGQPESLVLYCRENQAVTCRLRPLLLIPLHGQD